MNFTGDLGSTPCGLVFVPGMAATAALPTNTFMMDLLLICAPAELISLTLVGSRAFLTP
jgi:hypothetical protein